MSEVTGDQVREAMMAAGIQRVVIRECSMCGYPLAYLRDGAAVAYDAGCDCTGRRSIEPRSWFDVAHLINMQSDPKWRNKFRADFGMPAESEEPANAS